MRPAIEVWKEAIGVCFREYGVEDGEAATAVIEADRAELVAEIVAELREGDRGYWTWRDTAADHIEAQFGGRDAG